MMPATLPSIMIRQLAFAGRLRWSLYLALGAVACIPCADDVGYAAGGTVVELHPGSAWPVATYVIRVRIDGALHECEVSLPSAVTAIESCSEDASLDFLPLSGPTRSAVASMFVERSLPSDMLAATIERDATVIVDEELDAWEEETTTHEDNGHVCASSTFATTQVQLPW